MNVPFFPNPCTYVKESTIKILPKLSHVTIDEASLEKFISEILKNENLLQIPTWSKCHFEASSVDIETLLRYIFTIDTLNFCFWPNEGFEYDNLAKNLYEPIKQKTDFFEMENLIKITPQNLQDVVFKCNFCLLEERARMIREVFTIIKNEYNGLCTNFVKECNKDATKLVKKIIDNFCCFRDAAIYNGEQIFFYKRAQILVSDLYLAFLDIMNSKKNNEENDIINFTQDSISQLTMFADYRVPQILRAKGILSYDKYLSELVDNKKELAHGGKEEVEIRASTIQAVEKIKNELAKKGKKVLSIEIDVYLWGEGEKLKDKILPHHRTLSIFY